MEILGFSFRRQKPLGWPALDNGELVLPALLTTSTYDGMDVEITINMLTAYKIPTDKRRRKKTHEIDIFVPETMLEDAMALLTAEILPEEGEL